MQKCRTIEPSDYWYAPSSIGGTYEPWLILGKGFKLLLVLPNIIFLSCSKHGMHSGSSTIQYYCLISNNVEPKEDWNHLNYLYSFQSFFSQIARGSEKYHAHRIYVGLYRKRFPWSSCNLRAKTLEVTNIDLSAYMSIPASMKVYNNKKVAIIKICKWFIYLFKTAFIWQVVGTANNFGQSPMISIWNKACRSFLNWKWIHKSICITKENLPKSTYLIPIKFCIWKFSKVSKNTCKFYILPYKSENILKW